MYKPVCIIIVPNLVAFCRQLLARISVGRGEKPSPLSFSALCTARFLLILGMLWPPPLLAWNPDVAYGLPKQRRMCVKREGPDTLHFFSILHDEPCPEDARRYIVVFGKEPRGSIGLIAASTSHKFYPPLTLAWPVIGAEFSGSPLWHFTCVKPEQIDLLQSPIELLRYRGEITSTGKKDCLEAQGRALKFCQEEWKGEKLLEECPIGWGVP